MKHIKDLAHRISVIDYLVFTMIRTVSVLARKSYLGVCATNQWRTQSVGAEAFAATTCLSLNYSWRRLLNFATTRLRGGFLVVSQRLVRLAANSGRICVLAALFVVSPAPIVAADVTSRATLRGNLDASTIGISREIIPAAVRAGKAPNGTTTTYEDLLQLAAFSTTLSLADSRGSYHTVNLMFFRIAAKRAVWLVNAYVSSEEVDPELGEIERPRFVGATILRFSAAGTISNSDVAVVRGKIPWRYAARVSQVRISFERFTQRAKTSNVVRIRVG